MMIDRDLVEYWGLRKGPPGIFLLFVMSIYCMSACDPGDWRSLVDAQTMASAEITRKQADLIYRQCQDLPERSQLAFVLIDDAVPVFYGVEIRNDSLYTVRNEDRVFEIGSLTKLFTAYLLSEAVSKDSLDLKTTIHSLLPDRHVREPEITLLQLANHTSGLPRMPSNWSIWEADLQNPSAHFDRQYLLEYLEHDMTCETTPGEHFEYSNVGMAILGLALEAWTGQSYSELIEEWICQPMSLQHTSLDPDDWKALLVPGLNRKGEKIPYWDLNAMAPAGGLLSTTGDLSKFIIALLTCQENTHLTLRPTYKTYQGGQRLSVGLGWMMKSLGDEMIYWHNGGTAGFSCTVRMNTRTRIGVIILTNVSAIYGNKRVNIEHLADELMNTLIPDS